MYYNLGKREVNALCVKCDNVGRSCEWEGTVGTLEEHVATCDFTPVPCPKKCKQNDVIRKIMRKDLEEHLNEQCLNRDYKCEYCEKKDSYINITDVHDRKCEEKVIPCPNAECTETIKRLNLKNHLVKDCQYTVISCKLRSIGCDVEMKRKDMGAHEQDDKAHFHKALNTVVKLQDDLQSATETIKSLQEKYDNIVNKRKSFTFKLTEYRTKKLFGTEFNPSSFYTSTDGYKMCIIVYPNGSGDGIGTHVSVYVRILNGRNDKNLAWPFIGTIQIELLNQLADQKHYLRRLIFNKEDDTHAGKGWGYPGFIPHNELHAGEAQYLKDDTLYFRVSVEVTGYKHWLENKR